MNKKIAVSTRFHSWAENDFSSSLNIDELVVQHPAATFFIRVKSDLCNDEVKYGDILVIDRALSISNHRLMVARLDGQLVVRRVLLSANGITLINGQEMLTVTADRDFEVWGVITYIIRQI